MGIEDAKIAERSPDEKAGQLFAAHGERQLAQPQAPILETCHPAGKVEREAQVRDLELQGIDAAQALEVATGQAEQSAPLHEGETECALGLRHGRPAWADCRTIGRGDHGSMQSGADSTGRPSR